MITVNRENINEKINGLVNESDLFFMEMDHLSYLRTLRFQFTSKRLVFL
jgi:hypothetical protein